MVCLLCLICIWSLCGSWELWRTSVCEWPGHCFLSLGPARTLFGIIFDVTWLQDVASPFENLRCLSSIRSVISCHFVAMLHILQMCVFTPVSLIWFFISNMETNNPHGCMAHPPPFDSTNLLLRTSMTGTAEHAPSWARYEVLSDHEWCVSYCILVHHGINGLLHFHWLVFLCWHELEGGLRVAKVFSSLAFLGKLYLAHTWTTWKHPYLQKPWVSTDAAQCIIDNRAEWEFMVIKVYTSVMQYLMIAVLI